MRLQHVVVHRDGDNIERVYTCLSEPNESTPARIAGMKGTGDGVGLSIVLISAGVYVVDLSRPLRYVIMWLRDVPPYLPPDSRARDPRDLGEVRRWDDKVDGNRVNAELRSPLVFLKPPRTTLLCRERRHAFDSPKHIVGNGLITRELRLLSGYEYAIVTALQRISHGNSGKSLAL